MRVLILGGGISGLSLAWYLKRALGKEVKITLCEKSARLGGWIRTLDQEGFLFDLGPRSCRQEGNGLATLQLIEELGLQKALIHAQPTAAKQRYLFTGGTLQSIPKGLFGLCTSSLMRPLLLPLIKEWRVPKAAADESIHAFISRRLGNYAADYLFDPLTRGIYAGDSQQLSMQACFPKLFGWEQRQGSLTAGLLREPAPLSLPATPFVYAAQRKGLFTLIGGMEQLVNALKEQLSVDFYPNSTLNFSDFSSFDHVYLTVPAQAASELLSNAPEVAVLLKSIDFATVSVISMGYRRECLKQIGFGHLVPSCEGGKVMGMVWDSAVFPEHNRGKSQTRLTVMMSGAVKEAETLARAAVKEHLKIEAEPDFVSVHVAHQAIPQYRVGHVERVAALTQKLSKSYPMITLLGSSFYSVSVNDCIAHSKQIGLQKKE